MEIRILGSTEVLDGTRRVELPWGRGRALLALLILHAGEAVPAERLIDELWGEHPPPTAGTVVQGLVSRLRKALEPGRRKGEAAALLQTIGNGYRLAIEPDAVDASRFKRLINEARGAPPDLRSAMLSEALDLWRGPALGDFTYEPFAQRAIAALEELRVEAIEERFEADLALGRGGDLITELENLIAQHPLRERLWGFLMLALYRAGRQAEALETYRSARSLLVDEIGLEPLPALRELHAAILRQDPSLALPVDRRAGRHLDASAASWLPHERRTVTIVAVDVAPAAEPAVDAEAVGRMGARAASVATDVLERHGGRVERLIGDALIGFFGFPAAHEDDPQRAVRAAIEVRTAVEALNLEPSRIEGLHNRCRAGIETGDIVVPGPGAALREVVAGPVVTAASRLQQAAAEAEVLVGQSAQRLLRGTVILQPVEGVATSGRPATAWRVLEIVSRAYAVPRALEAPMFGRQGELTRLRSAFRRMVRLGASVRTTILGEAGIGKSRLAKELVASIGTAANAITLRCPAHVDGGTFFPLREAMVEAAGLHGWRGLHELLTASEDGRRAIDDIATAIGLRAEPGTGDVLFPAVRRLFATLASERPLIVVLEDLHWSSPTFLDLVDYLARETREHIFLLCLARPDLIERRPDWDSHVLSLEPLSSDDVESLVVERAESIDPNALRRIVAVSQGNPLFAEQMLAAYDDGAVEAVPASLRGLLTMRLDRLGPGERDLLRCASIVGMDLEREALSALLPDDARPFVDRHLDTLVRMRFIRRIATNTFRFGHALIQMAAYESMTRDDRARLHERFADWLEHRSPQLLPELNEILGYHLEVAIKHRRESGEIGPDAHPRSARARPGEG
ncbi:MAG: BTAD domain-containing putative transcriptional regulator [Actinomycetota bacterium]